LKKTLNQKNLGGGINTIVKYKKNSSRANGNVSNVSGANGTLNYSIGGPINNNNAS
jgi:hypothetical protein